MLKAKILLSLFLGTLLSIPVSAQATETCPEPVELNSKAEGRFYSTIIDSTNFTMTSFSRLIGDSELCNASGLPSPCSFAINLVANVEFGATPFDTVNLKVTSGKAWAVLPDSNTPKVFGAAEDSGIFSANKGYRVHDGYAKLTIRQYPNDLPQSSEEYCLDIKVGDKFLTQKGVLDCGYVTSGPDQNGNTDSKNICYNYRDFDEVRDLSHGKLYVVWELLSETLQETPACSK